MKKYVFLISLILSYVTTTQISHFVKRYIISNKGVVIIDSEINDCPKSKDQCVIYFSKFFEIEKNGYIAKIYKNMYAQKNSEGNLSSGYISSYNLKLESNIFTFETESVGPELYNKGVTFFLKEKKMNLDIENEKIYIRSEDSYVNCENNSFNKKNQCVQW